MPAGTASTEPWEQQRRFELRQCGGDHIIVLAYANHSAEPSLVFDTGDGYPRYFAHIGNVVVFQSIGGASDHVYVFVFEGSKPSLALKTATKGLIQVKQSEKAILVVVPPTIYPRPDGQVRGQPPTQPSPKEYSFPVD
jgi:hypothetical protein